MKPLSRRRMIELMLAGSALCAGGGFAFAADPEDDLARLARQMGLEVSADNLRRAKAILRQTSAADLHAHPARFFIRGAEDGRAPLSPELAQAGDMVQSVADMQAGGLGVACFAVVSDYLTLGLKPNGSPGAVRSFEKGQAWADYQRQVREFRSDLARVPQLMPILGPDDIDAARAAGRVGALLTAEGGDFLEGEIARLGTAYADGVRSITIVHYRVNEIGDIQTEAPVHNGLSPFGRALVADMNRLGMIVDLAHASFATAKAACDVTSKPVMLSHGHLGHSTGGLTQRLLTRDHARMIAETGGIIGCWPAGVVQKNFADFVSETLRLVDAVGVDHVALGTDMDGNYKPVFNNYRQLPLLPAMLLERGLSEPEVTKIIGGNFARVFRAATV